MEQDEESWKLPPAGVTFEFAVMLGAAKKVYRGVFARKPRVLPWTNSNTTPAGGS